MEFTCLKSIARTMSNSDCIFLDGPSELAVNSILLVALYQDEITDNTSKFFNLKKRHGYGMYRLSIK